jgi:1-deoxy-D-xylulose-5-phosphate reductoisomerase
MKRIALLGATGSIGLNVLDVVRQFPQHYSIAGLAAGRNISLLARLVLEFKPLLISVLDAEHASQICALLPGEWRTKVVSGTAGNELVASLPMADMTISAIVGAAGLLPTLAAIRAGKDIGLANKETLVMAGKIVMDAVKKYKVRLLPVDSEHSAIFQALEGGRREDLEKIILTASGGPFREKGGAELENVTPEQALAHPNWNMGRKISIDSATLMNKGLEVIEARWLFDVSLEMIEVVVHPQSIIHSLVEFQDGSLLAQLGIPDMRVPIAYALSYPARLPLQLKRLQLSQCRDLQFYEPDFDRFPALGLAFDALRQGGVLPAVLNAANEVAVEAFLDARISFPAIARTVALTMERVDKGSEDSLDDILQADLEARREAWKIIADMFGRHETGWQSALL